MPDPATDPGSGQRPGRGTKVLAGLAGLACVACCLLPVLLAAGVLGASAAALVGWLPALAAALAALAVAVWWLQRRRSRPCTHDATGACRCAEPHDAHH